MLFRSLLEKTGDYGTKMRYMRRAHGAVAQIGNVHRQWQRTHHSVVPVRRGFCRVICTGRQNVTAFSRKFSLSPKTFKNRPCSGHVLRPARGWRVPNPPGLCHTVQSRKAQRRGNAMKRTKGISLLAALLAGVCLGGAAAAVRYHLPGTEQPTPERWMKYQ